MIKPVQNPIAQRSQAWLTDALLSLMSQKPYADISITEIAARADLSRRTFYRLFDSREDVLAHWMETQYAVFCDRLRAEAPTDYLGVIRLYFTFWNERREILSLLWKNDLFPLLSRQCARYFPEVFCRIKADTPLARDPDALRYAMSFSAGGLVSVLARWAEEGMRRTPDEMMRLIERFLPSG